MSAGTSSSSRFKQIRAVGLSLRHPKYLGYADRKGFGGTTYFLVSGDPEYMSESSDFELIDYFGVTETRVITESWLVAGKAVPRLTEPKGGVG